MHLIELISNHRKEIHCAAEKCTSPYIQSICRIQTRAAALEGQPREQIPENANPTQYLKNKSESHNQNCQISLVLSVLFPTEKLKFILSSLF